MLIRVSRALLWLAACAAVAALIGPAQDGTWLTVTAGLSLIVALGLWRAALRQRRLRVDDGEPMPMTRLDEAALMEIAVLCARCCAEAATPAALVEGVARLLRSELGSREAQGHLLQKSPEVVVSAPWPPRVRATPPIVIEVRLDDQPAASIELSDIALAVAPNALNGLIDLVRAQVAEALRRMAPPASDEDERTRLRRQLTEFEAWTREFAGTVDDGLFVANPQRNRFEFVAASTFDTWGVTPAQVDDAGQVFLQRVIEEDRPLLMQRLERELRGEDADVSFRIDHPGKGRRWLRSRTRTRAQPDGSMRVHGVVTDITEDPRREQDLERARDEAQAASRAKSRFLATMSHEIRAPMNGILGMTELLLGTPLDERQQRFAQAVCRSGENLLEIIDDILDFSRIEAGRLELAPADFPVRAVVEVRPSGRPGALQAGFERLAAEPARKAERRQALRGVTSSRQGAPAPIDHRGRQVLVVEDNAVNQEVVAQMLRRQGCRVQLASGATEGLRALCEQSFDLVLMDIQMPGMDGVATLHEFRHGRNGRYRFKTVRNTPVVAVTANALSDDERRFIDLGFDDCLPKPFRQSQLTAMLNRNLKPLRAPLADDAPPAGGAGPAGVPAGTVLDPLALARLRELDPKGENNLLERVLQAFETSVARLLPQLHEAQRSGDLAGVRHVAHTLKSSTASIGANQLSQQCAEIETLIRLESVGDLQARVQAMDAELERVLQQVRRVMGQKR